MCFQEVTYVFTSSISLSLSPLFSFFCVCLFGAENHFYYSNQDRDEGKLIVLSKNHIVDLEQALATFKKKYGIANESYHYTPWSVNPYRYIVNCRYIVQLNCICPPS